MPHTDHHSRSVTSSPTRVAIVTIVTSIAELGIRRRGKGGEDQRSREHVGFESEEQRAEW